MSAVLVTKPLIKRVPVEASPFAGHAKFITADGPSLMNFPLPDRHAKRPLESLKMGQAPQSRSTPKGVFVTLDGLDYTYEPIQTPPGKPHVFTYHLTIHNQSEGTITILARKWVLHAADGQIEVIEGECP